MSGSGVPEATEETSVAAAEVAAFLKANPTFFEQHTALLEAMHIPHASGTATSLLERQVGLLREENARLKNQLEQLLDFARQNETLNGKIHTLALALMNAVGARAIFSCLDEHLRADFGADTMRCLVFADSAATDTSELARFDGARSQLRLHFEAELTAGSSRCGALAKAQRDALFEPDQSIGSAVVMPLNAKDWDGVLVIASAEASRYQDHMGTEFLNYLKDVVALVVDPWVKRAR